MIKSFTQIIAITILIISSIHAFAADSTEVKKNRYTKSLSFFFQAGDVIQTNTFVQGENISGEPIDKFLSLGFKYGIETDGRKYWQQNYLYPVWGFGIYTATFFNEEELGTPSAIYAFFNAPFIRFNKWSINYRAKFGFSYDWKAFDPEVNPFNYAIGSYNTVFVDVGAYVNIELGKRFDLALGYSLSHFSNGATKMPNLGINLAAPFVELKYRFKDRTEFIKIEKPKFKKKWEYVALVALSSKQLAFDTTSVDSITGFIAESYGIITLSTGVNYQVSHKVKFGAGFDIGWDGAYNSYITYDQGHVERHDAGSGNKLTIGIYPSFELVINKLSVIVQPGWYLYREDYSIPESTPENKVLQPSYKSPDSYQRIGLKYHILENVFLGFNVRAYNFSIADYLEWNIGYRLR